MRPLLPTIVLLFTIPFAASAWGPGHDDIQKAILDRLPASLTQGLDPTYIDALIRQYSHYPDSFEPFDTSLIGTASLQRLAGHNITKRYDLHHDRNRAVAFLELVHAIRENDNKRANFWIACLAHSAADMAAINHDPMTHVVYYLWGKEKQVIKTPKGGFPGYLDIHDVASAPLGQRIFGERIEALRVKDSGKGLSQVLAEVMFYGHEGAHFLATRGFGILETATAYSDSRNDALLPELFSSMSDLGAWAVVRILRDVEAAVRIAGSTVSLEVSSEAADLYKQKVDRHLRDRTLDDGMYASIHTFQAKQQEKAIGILAEPSWRMNDGLLGFTERVLSFQIANTLRGNSMSFRLFNVVTVLTEGFPDPKTTPVMILPIRQADKSYHWMNLRELAAPLKAYLASGGKIIWIGGDPPSEEVLPQLARSMIQSGEKEWPLPEMDKTALVLHNTSETWALTGELKPKVGWQTISCPYIFEKEKMKQYKAAPFLSLESYSGNTTTIGAMWPLENHSFIFLPGYALIPFLWTSEAALPVPMRDASLDEAGTRILKLALNHLSVD